MQFSLIYRKPFDRVWQDALIYKLLNYDTPRYIVKVIDSYLNNRNFVVRVNNDYSENKNILSGVAQGSKIGPVLFSLYINDIPKQYNTLLCMYADDTAILARNNNMNYVAIALNRHLKALEVWFVKWKIAINVSKTEAVMFSKAHRTNKFPKIQMDKKIIPWSEECKYLGLTLDRRLTWKSHFVKLKQKFRNLARMFYPILSRHSKMPRENKLLIYKSYLLPVLTYGSAIWGYAAKSNLKIISTSNNVIIRAICKVRYFISNTEIYKALELPTFNQHIAKLAEKFYRSIDDHENDAIKLIPNYAPGSKAKRPRNVLLLE